jgi:hypothetical protein
MIEIHNLLKKVFKEQKQEFGVFILAVVGRDGVNERDKSMLGRRNLKAMNNIPIAS